MKPAIAIALIVCGVVLVCVPPISDHLIREQLLQYEVAIANSTRDMGEFSLKTMDASYRDWCFFLGAAMIVIAVVGSWVKGGSPADSPVRPTQV